MLPALLLEDPELGETTVLAMILEASCPNPFDGPVPWAK